MANDQNTTQHTQQSDAAGDDKRMKLAGKYESAEELEKGYKELERKYHEGNERYVKLEDRLNQLETRDEGYGRGQTYVEPVITPKADGSQFLTRFYSDPEGTLAEVEERATQKAVQRLTRAQQQQADYANRIARWSAENQEVAKYGDLLTYYVGQTDAKLTPERRLDIAAEHVRARVLELKSKPTKQNDDPEQFVDGATSNHEGGSGGHAAPVATPAAESQLKAYTAARNATVRKPLQHGGTRK
jgi:hypothetical protein